MQTLRTRNRAAIAWLAVGTLAAPANGQSSALKRQVEGMLERSRPALERHLRSASGGQLALACLAAAHDGMSWHDAPLDQAVERLLKTNGLRTYGLAIRIMVMAYAADHPQCRDTIARDCAALLTHQNPDGYFGYRPHDAHTDLSNTQYAALGLRVATRYGGDVPDDCWERLIEATLGSQMRQGGFGYRPVKRQTATSSMTVAGIAVLEIGAQMLDLDADEQRTVKRAIDNAWRWCRKHTRDIGDATKAHCAYYHYGLERAAILSGKDRVGKTDWYSRGVKMLAAHEAKQGGFRIAGTGREGHDTLIDTSFGILFLRRRFQRTLQPTGPTTPGPSHLCHTLPPDAGEAQVRSAIRIDVGRGRHAVPDLLEAMRSVHYVRRKAAAIALMKISGQDFRYHPSRNATRNAAALRRAERWWLSIKNDSGR